MFTRLISRIARVLPLAVCAAMSAIAGGPSRAATTEWKPVTADELKMTSVPGAPGASAVCLFSEIFSDDIAGREKHYMRIKVLTEEGRAQGNLQIPYVKGYWDLNSLQTRTIQPDGTIADNPAAPMDSVIWRYRRIKTLAKTVALPAIQVGTILEYQYEIQWNRQYLLAYPWVVNSDLFTVRASFVRRRLGLLNLRMYSSRMPEGVEPKVGPDGLIRLELNNVPPAAAEDFMPPEAETRPRVDFCYYSGKLLGEDTDAVWAEKAKVARESIDKYLAKDHGLDQFVAETIKPDDSAEIKLRRLYERVQGMRNLSFIPEKDRAQFERENVKWPENVQDVLKRGYGSHGDLDLLFLAAVTHAGFQAWFLDVARRDGELFFDARNLSLGSLPGRAVLVQVGSKNYFLDPGTVLLPFGWLPWGETSVRALKLDVVAGGLITTPGTKASESVLERNAKLRLDETGKLAGTVTVTYSGHPAFDRRMEAREKDDLARKQMLENELQEWLGGKAEVELQNKPEWSRADPTLVAEFTVNAQGWAIVTGHRMMFAEGILSEAERMVFRSEHREYDLYFGFPEETRDTIEISLPKGYGIASLPGTKDRDLMYMSYRASADTSGSGVRISRRVTLAVTSLPVKTYPAVYAFYEDLRSTDESQILLQTDGAQPAAAGP